MPRTDEKYIEHGKFVKPKTNILQKFGKISRGADVARKTEHFEEGIIPPPPIKNQKVRDRP